MAIIHMPERVVAVTKVHDAKLRVVAVSLLPQRVLVDFFAHLAFSHFERNIYIPLFFGVDICSETGQNIQCWVRPTTGP
jgi:hypothetical protein